MPLLPPVPAHDREAVVAWVREHLGDLACDDVRASPVRGGQDAADAALATLDLTGYARRRSRVLPHTSRGATRLSPCVRHGLLPLPVVRDAAAEAPAPDRREFRDGLLWQEYARHLYARLGRATLEPLRAAAPVTRERWDHEPWDHERWWREMLGVDAAVGELEDEGWLVDQARMWLSSQWSVRAGADWREGAQRMYAHLLDGSPAANRLGCQWTVGTGSGKAHGFSRWQVQERAPALCRDCPLDRRCPVQDWPDADAGPRVEPPAGLTGGPTDTGPVRPEVDGEDEAVWLTAESLGDLDPARQAHPDLPAVLVLDEPLLRTLRSSVKRLVFLAEALGGVEVRRGDPVQELAGRPLAATWAHVTGWERRAARLAVGERHRGRGCGARAAGRCAPGAR